MNRLAFLTFLLAPVLAAQWESKNLINPKALGPAPQPESAATIRQRFADPPADYRSMPLWVWNDELEWPRLQQQLNQFRQQGMGGVFVHPRPGLMTEYLGADWFRLWKLSAGEGKKLGMRVNIYDENSYPSGFAGGLVPARAPDTASQYVQAIPNLTPRSVNWMGAETVAVFAVPEGASDYSGARRVRRADEFPAGHKVLLFRLRRASGNPWTAEFPYVDLTNPQTAPNFIATTFEPYKRELGLEFGKTIKWAFDDEPLLATGGAYDSASLALPLSFYSLAEFRKRCGYDLADHIPSLYWDVGEFRKVRFDYWQTMHDLWKENYLRPIFLWCDRNNLQFTGHWMEHEWPAPWITPADASLYAYEHVPGIDMLEGSVIRQKGADPHMLFTIRQVASVARQLGRRAFCEAYGVAGWDSTFEHYKRFGDWLQVHGIDFMNQHLAFATVRGARKRDHPQSFTDVSPWWPYYKLHGDYLGRVSYMLSRGESRNRLLLLQPTTSGFLWARRGEDVPEFGRMRKSNGELIQFLADRQVDFDLGDEYIMEWFGKQENRKMVLGKAAYDLLVWPEEMINVRKETIPHLERYLAAGGEILALSEPATYVDGRPSEKVRALRDRYASQWRSVSGLPELLAEVQRRLPPRVRFDTEFPTGVAFAERFLQGGDRILFFTNTGLSPVRARATVEGGSLEQWDPITGRTSPAAFQPGLSFALDLPPAGSRMFVVRKAAAAPPRPQAEALFTAVAGSEWTVEADSANVLVLDYCDFVSTGVDLKDINTWRANWTLWNLHGFERPAWDNAVQFKTRVYDRNHFPPGSGFDAAFRFEVADAAAIQGLQLAIELPELYKVKVNGQPVSFAGGERWMDPHILAVNIEKFAKTGENTVVITGRPFDVRMELENIYLRGHFSVAAASKGFQIAARSKLALGAWAKQGMPFYAGSVLYSTGIEVPAGAQRAKVGLPEWQGSVAAVLLDGKQVATLGWPPYEAEFAAAPGKHRIGVRVVSTPRNIFGPFHNRTKPRMRAWPAAWHDFPEHQPAGETYDILDYGLESAPAVSVGGRS